jgi:hypothetical protein
MDQQNRDHPQFDDLELTDEAAEEVKGGFHWGVSQSLQNSESVRQTISPGSKAQDFHRSVDGGTVQHNETLVQV